MRAHLLDKHGEVFRGGEVEEGEEGGKGQGREGVERVLDGCKIVVP